MPFVEGIWHFVRGRAFIATGKLQEATSELERVKAAANDPVIARLQTRLNPARTILTLSAETLSGETAAARGEIDSALLHFETAIRMEDGLAYMEPPDWDDPVRLSLGGAS
jgi:tetratricopeptide (TPR) repeat protein